MFMYLCLIISSGQISRLGIPGFKDMYIMLSLPSRKLVEMITSTKKIYNW